MAKNKNNENKKNKNRNTDFANDQLGENRTECADELSVNRNKAKNNFDCKK